MAISSLKKVLKRGIITVMIPANAKQACNKLLYCVYIYCFVLASVDPEMPTNVGNCK